MSEVTWGEYQTKKPMNAPEDYKPSKVQARELKSAERIECPVSLTAFPGQPGDWVIKMPDYERPLPIKDKKDGKAIKQVVKGRKFLVKPTQFWNSYEEVKAAAPAKAKESKKKDDK